MIERTGVLLVNLGTPRSPATRDVRRYLREFLSDPYVIDLPWVARKALLELVILPLRPRKSAAAYRSIWTDRGSPLLTHGEDLCDALRARLGDDVVAVELAMRYGEPRIADGVARIVAAGADRIVVLPLFPQYAQSSWSSAVAAADRALAAHPAMLPARVVAPYYDDPRFIDAAAAVAARELAAFEPDHVLLSFHGLPERHVRATDLAGAGEPRCLSDGCCEVVRAGNRFCYRAQCCATARALAAALRLPADRHGVAFQSRLGRTPWIRPFTDERIAELARAGVRRLAVVCPSFVADCLETLEEIGIRGAEIFEQNGGSELRLVPCVNADPAWVGAAEGLVRDEMPGRGSLQSGAAGDRDMRPGLRRTANQPR